MEQRRLIGLITRRESQPGSIPGPATVTTQGATRLSYGQRLWFESTCHHHYRYLKLQRRPPISGLASFSLRSAAHVATYAPLRCSRKPRQNAELGERVFLKVLARVSPLRGRPRVGLHTLNVANARSNRAPGTMLGESSKRSRRSYKPQLPGALPGPSTTRA